MTLVLLVSALNGALVLLLLVPEPEQRFSPWDNSDHRHPESLSSFVQRQVALTAGSGVAINPMTFLGLRIGLTVAGAVGMGLMLGPVSALCGGIAVWLVMQEWLKTRREARLLLFADQFRETLQSITNSLKVGRSMQQAMMQAYHDLVKVPGRERDLLATELARMLEEMQLGATPDEVLKGLVQRVSLEEVRLFAEAVILCRIRGGNLVLVLQTLIRLNVDRFQVRQEIKVQTAQKRGEGTILSVLPVVMLILLTTVAPEYMAPLTSTPSGQAAVGIGLFLVLAAYLISRTMTRIEV